MSQPFVRLRIAMGVALVVFGASMAAFVLAGKKSSEPAAAAQGGDTPKAEPEPELGPGVDVETEPPAPKPEPMSKQKLDRQASDRMRAQIHQSLGQHGGGGPAPRSADPADARDEPPTAEQPPALDREYIQARIREDLLPVAVECYESALSDDPELAGELAMDFAILGDPDVGGVVDEASIDQEKSTLANEFVRECVRESLMAVNFDAPPDGGRVDVSYSFKFSPDEPED
jgi:hypothetical protein